MGYQHNEYFFRAIQKYGWNNFEHKILLKNLTEEQASYLERFFISYWNLNNKEYGYNLTSGGSKGYTQSQKTKDKISNSNTSKVFTEEHRKKLSENAKKRTGDKNPFYGKHHGEETLHKISQNRKSKGGKQVRCINTGEIFPTMMDAARWCGLKNSSSIGQVCNKTGKQKTAGKHP